MYNSDVRRWNALEMGGKREVRGELAAAVRAQRLIFGLSSHRVEHWWVFARGCTFDSDVRDPAYSDFDGPPLIGRHPRRSKLRRSGVPRRLARAKCRTGRQVP